MCSCFSIHKCFTVSHMVDCVRLLYTMYRTYNTILHNLGVITVGAAESWDTASGGAGMLLQSQWGSSGAGQEHLEWNRNTIHPLPTGTENHNVFKLAAIFYYRLRHTCTHRYCQSQLCSQVPGTCTSSEFWLHYWPIVYIYLPAILAPGCTRVTLIMEGFPPTRTTPGVAVIISWRGLPFALTGSGPHVSW